MNYFKTALIKDKGLAKKVQILTKKITILYLHRNSIKFNEIIYF